MAKKPFKRLERPATAEERRRHAEIRQKVMEEFPPALSASRLEPAKGEVRSMAATERQQNQDAFRKLRDHIKRTYPRGRFIAIAGGQIIADEPSFEELDAALDNMGRNSTDILVVQAGVEYPENLTIFAGQQRP